MINNNLEVAHLFSKPFPPIAFLLAGNSELKKHIFLSDFIKQLNFLHSNSYSTQVLEFKEVKNNISVLYNLLNSILITGFTIVIVKEVEGNFPLELQQFLVNYSGPNFCIFLAKNLNKNSKWCQFFTGTSRYYLYSFYTALQVEKVIEQAFIYYKLPLTQEVSSFLAQVFILDEEHIFKEVCKLSYLIKKGEAVMLEEAIECCLPSKFLNISDFCRALLEKNVKDLLKNFAAMEEIPILLIIRSSINYIIALIQIKYLCSEGKSDIEALKAINYKIFLRDFLAVKEQLNVLSVGYLRNIALHLFQIENDIKLVSKHLQPALFQQEVIFLAKKP